MILRGKQVFADRMNMSNEYSAIIYECHRTGTRFVYSDWAIGGISKPEDEDKHIATLTDCSAILAALKAALPVITQHGSTDLVLQCGKAIADAS